MAEDGLSRWAHKRDTKPIPLPSGAGKCVIRPIDIHESVARGHIPNALLSFALKAESGGLNLADELRPPEERREEIEKWFDLMCVLVAHAVKEYRPHRAKPIAGPLSVEFVRDEMPVEDRIRIFAIATHLVTVDELDQIAKLANQLELAPFRGKQVRAADVGDGNGPRPAPEPTPRD